MLADEDLWRLFEAIGVDAVHTGPVKRAGGISGWDVTPSVDGHFDRISTRIDEAFGTEVEFRSMCEVAAAHGGTIIDDIVPGHTGKGADFRLAEMKVGDYPGIYHMVEIPPEDWHLLPPVPQGKDSVNLDLEAEDRLAKAGYIIGKMQRVIFHGAGCQRHELERHRGRHWCRRGGPSLGVFALLQGWSAIDQLAGPHERRHAAGDG
jgi:trehalose synthase